MNKVILGVKKRSTGVYIQKVVDPHTQIFPPEFLTVIFSSSL